MLQGVILLICTDAMNISFWQIIAEIRLFFSKKKKFIVKQEKS